VNFNVLLPFFRQFERSVFGTSFPESKNRGTEEPRQNQTLWCPFWGNSSGFVRGLAINILNQKTYKFSDLPVGESGVNECVSFF